MNGMYVKIILSVFMHVEMRKWDHFLYTWPEITNYKFTNKNCVSWLSIAENITVG